MQKISPCLWFDGRAEDAMKFYVGLFPNARVTDVMHYGDGAPYPKGSVLSCEFELEGQAFTALNGPPMFAFTPAVSFLVRCETQAEVDRYWSALLEGGQPMQCGWLTDRFGVTWQIVPNALGRMLKDPDSAKADRVMQAMMKMVKLDIATLQKAFDTV